MAVDNAAVAALPLAPTTDVPARSPGASDRDGPEGSRAAQPFRTVLDAAVALRSRQLTIARDDTPDDEILLGGWLDEARLAELKARLQGMGLSTSTWGPRGEIGGTSGGRAGRIDQTDRRQYDTDSQAQLWGPSACSATALVMMLHTYGQAGRIADAISALGGAISPARGLLQREALPRAGRQMGLDLSDQAMSYETLQRLTAAGVPVMLDLTNGRFPAGHWLVVTGADATGVTVLDSSGYNLQRMDRAEFMAAWNGKGMFVAGATAGLGQPPALGPGPAAVGSGESAAGSGPSVVAIRARGQVRTSPVAAPASPGMGGAEAVVPADSVVPHPAATGPAGTDGEKTAVPAVAGPVRDERQSSGLADQRAATGEGSDRPPPQVVGAAASVEPRKVDTERPAEPAGTAAQTRAERAAVIDQLVRSAHLYSAGAGHGAHIRLQPDSLGSVDVRVVVADGKVQLWMSTETEAARHAIQNSWADLRGALRDRGLDAQQLVLQSSGGISTFVGDGRGQEGRPQPQPASVPVVQPAPAETVETVSATEEPLGTIDYRV